MCIPKKTRRILFVIPDQFGYSAGYYYYCKYLLENDYAVSVLSIDLGKPKIDFKNPNFKSHYIEPKNKIWRFQLINKTLKLKNETNVFIIKYFSFISILKVFLKKDKVILDIRTGSVRENKLLRVFDDIVLKLETVFFEEIFILSTPLARKLNIPQCKIIYLPLGADEIATENKCYSNKMAFLYIGTLNGRNLKKFIEGFSLFYNEYKNKIEITFDIIGRGNNSEVNLIEQAIKDFELQKAVTFHGELNHQQASPFFEKCNYGISYIPITDFYQLQPPTKNFEYALSGLVCIATSTKANRELITSENGLLHKDDSNSTFLVLKNAYKKRFTYKTEVIKQSLQDYTWSNIVKNIIIHNI